PGGSLGCRLLTRVSDVMHRENLPICSPNATFRDIVHTITRGRLGLALVMEGQTLRGIITDGDIRRTFDKVTNPMELVAADIMTTNPRTIGHKERFADAEELMRVARINSLVVTDDTGAVVGVLQIYDINAVEAN